MTVGVDMITLKLLVEADEDKNHPESTQKR